MIDAAVRDGTADDCASAHAAGRRVASCAGSEGAETKTSFPGPMQTGFPNGRCVARLGRNVCASRVGVGWRVYGAQPVNNRKNKQLVTRVLR